MKRFLLYIGAILLVCGLFALLPMLEGYFDPPNYDPPPSVQIDGQLYHRRGVEGDHPEEGQILGTINSTVSGDQSPQEDGQSNLAACQGQPYAFVDGVLLVREDTGLWYYYEPSES